MLTDRTRRGNGRPYAIATDLDTRGLASVFVDLEASEVHGHLAAEPHPISTAPICAETAPIVTTASITATTVGMNVSARFARAALLVAEQQIGAPSTNLPRISLWRRQLAQRPAPSSFPYSTAAGSISFVLPMLNAEHCPQTGIGTSPVETQVWKSSKGHTV
jgi:hypothetical protein